MSAWDDGIHNGKIESTLLGDASEHDIFTWIIMIDYGGGGQGFMGPCLDEPLFDGNPQYTGDKRGKFLGRRGTAFGCECIMRLLKAVGVDNWEQLKGVPVRVKKEDGLIRAIGHYLHDDWFDPREVAKEFGIE